MVKRMRATAWSRVLERSLKAMAPAARAGRLAASRLVESRARALRPPPGAGDWLAGVAFGAAGVRRYRLFQPAGMSAKERLPLLVMLHGCGQDAHGFAASTRMNSIAARERFLVLYPEQDRLANANGCWNWFDTDSGRAHGEAALILKAIDQVCTLYRVDRTRIAVAGLSAGASMAALLASHHPDRFKAVVMHSGIPPGTAHSAASALGAMRGLRLTAALREPPAQPGHLLPALLVIHGGADKVVSVKNGHAAVQVWAQACGALAGSPRSVQRGQRYPMTVTDFRVGTRTAARLVEVGQLAHAWSGGAARLPYGDSAGPDASRLAWAFVAQQLKR